MFGALALHTILNKVITFIYEKLNPLYKHDGYIVR